MGWHPLTSGGELAGESRPFTIQLNINLFFTHSRSTQIKLVTFLFNFIYFLNFTVDFIFSYGII